MALTEPSDKDATNNKEILLEAVARLQVATDAENENRVKALIAIDFVELGNQWPVAIKNERDTDGRPALTINHTQTVCRRVQNTIRQQRPRIKCHPVGDGADVDTAKVVNGLIRHIETNSNASVAYDLGAKSSTTIGWGYWRIVSEYIDEKSFDQELKIKPIRNTFTVYMDPAAVMPAGEDQQWCIITEKIKRREYKRLYPNASNCEWQSDGPGDVTLDWESKEELRLAEYFRIHEMKDTLVKFSDGSVKFRSEFADEASMAAIAATGLTIVAERPSARRQVEWYRINGKEVLEKRVIPGPYIPVIRCEGNVTDVNGRVVRSGMVENMMDPQRMYNYWRTQQTERYALAPKAPWVTAEGQTEGHPEWNNANQRAYSQLVYKPIAGPDGSTPLPPPQRTNPAQVEAGMAEAAQGAEHDLMAVAGMPQENPEVAARVMSGNKYLQRRQGMQDLTHFQYYDNQTLAIMWTGIILLAQIPYYYDTERMQRIIGDDGVPQMVSLNARQEQDGIWRVKNDMTIGRYDVVMDTGPGYATKREEGAEQMMELLNTPLGEVVVKTGSDVVLRNMDFNGADVLADRAMVTNPDAMEKAVEGLPDQAKNIIGAMKAQLEQAQETIQQQALEIKYGRGIAELKEEGATKRTLITATGKAHDTERKAESDDLNSARDFEGWQDEVSKNVAAKVHVANIQRDTALDVAEIKVGGQLLNTRVEAAHEAAAADKAIKAGQTDRKPNGA